MQNIKTLTKNTILYARSNNYLKHDSSSIKNEIEKGRAYASSRGWNLKKEFIDVPDNNIHTPIFYKIKDMAVCKYQKHHPPRRLLMPKRVPVYADTKKDINRVAFQDMISYLAENPVHVLLTTKLEQLFENLKDLRLFINDELDPRGIELQSIHENFNTHSSNGKSFLQMLDSFEEFKYLSCKNDNIDDKKRIWN